MVGTPLTACATPPPVGCDTGDPVWRYVISPGSWPRPSPRRRALLRGHGEMSDDASLSAASATFQAGMTDVGEQCQRAGVSSAFERRHLVRTPRFHRLTCGNSGDFSSISPSCSWNHCLDPCSNVNALATLIASTGFDRTRWRLSRRPFARRLFYDKSTLLPFLEKCARRGRAFQWRDA